MKTRNTLKDRAQREKDLRRFIADSETNRSVARQANQVERVAHLDRMIALYREELDQLRAA